MLGDKNFTFFECATPLEVDSKRKQFLKEVKSLLCSLGKMIGEQLRVYHRLKRLAINDTCGRIVLDNLI